MYLVRLDHNGKVTKTKNIGTFSVSNAAIYYSSNTYSAGICRDYKGDFYITGNISGTQTIGGKTLSSVKGKIIFAKFDKDFNLIWVIQTGNSISSLSDKVIYSSGHVYFICSSTELTTVGKNTYPLSKTYNPTFSRNRTYIYGELKPSDGSILWNKCLYITPASTYFEITGMVYLKNKIYLSGNTYNNAIVGIDTFLKDPLLPKQIQRVNIKSDLL